MSKTHLDTSKTCNSAKHNEKNIAATCSHHTTGSSLMSESYASLEHGGDLLRLATLSGHAPEEILDFSVNIRPDGPPEYVQQALIKAVSSVISYPSPDAAKARQIAGRRYGMAPENFVFGNGSNELFHALARALRKQGIVHACILEPAFSEYALACERAGIEVTHIPLFVHTTDSPCGMTHIQEVHARDILASLLTVPANTAVFFANPANPSGVFLSLPEGRDVLRARPDLIWIIDEAFIDYLGEEKENSLLFEASERCIVLRSLTKFYAIPGVRLGYLATGKQQAAAVQKELPAWNINAFAMAAACAILGEGEEHAARIRSENNERRVHLKGLLENIAGISVIPSVTNYLLCHWENIPEHLPLRLLTQYGIALRDCSNYHSLSDGHWFRVAVRLPEEHHRLVTALKALSSDESKILKDTLVRADTVISKKLSHNALTPVPTCRQKKTPALMIQGTSSHAGKSILAAAFCRILRQDGYTVAPFKGQNMSLNSGVTLDGGEVGRAQIVQARAACIEPDVRMNPILLKPQSDTGSQVIVLGQPTGHMSAREYFSRKHELWQTISGAYDTLAATHDVMILEGAGSPAEVNLKDADVVNMRMALHARASVLLVGDIDRGGVYASFLGTWMTFSCEERALLTGYLVNRFRGDASLLADAHTYMLRQTAVPVVGVVPYMRDLHIPEEDMAGLSWGRVLPEYALEGILDIAIVMPRHVSNFTDIEPLMLEPDVCVRPVYSVETFGTPHVVILPGSRHVMADLALLRECGLADKILEHAGRDAWIFGICGGLQMMGSDIHDPNAVESDRTTMSGLGVMPLQTVFAAQKTLVRVQNVQTPLGVCASGYEIHHGQTIHESGAVSLVSPEGRVCGFVQGKRWTTYLHGIFDDDVFRRTFLDHVRKDVGLKPQGRVLATYNIEEALDRLADVVRASVDLPHIYKSMGLS